MNRIISAVRSVIQGEPDSAPNADKMPPMLSDEEMEEVSDVEPSDDDAPDAIPARQPAKKAAEPASEAEDNDDEEGEEGDDEYQVEKIIKHEYHEKSGEIMYRIKWLGYDTVADQTWEPLDNLEGAKAVLDAYHAKIGGTPPPTMPKEKKTPATKGKGRGRKRSTSAAAEEAPSEKKKRGRPSTTNGKSESKLADDGPPPLPLGTWEDDVEAVTAIIQDIPSTTGGNPTDSLRGLLNWTSGRKTEHTMQVLRQKCPQRLLDYYETHLTF